MGEGARRAPDRSPTPDRSGQEKDQPRKSPKASGEVDYNDHHHLRRSTTGVLLLAHRKLHIGRLRSDTEEGFRQVSAVESGAAVHYHCRLPLALYFRRWRPVAPARSVRLAQALRSGRSTGGSDHQCQVGGLGKPGWQRNCRFLQLVVSGYEPDWRTASVGQAH